MRRLILTAVLIVGLAVSVWGCDQRDEGFQSSESESSRSQAVTPKTVPSWMREEYTDTPEYRAAVAAYAHGDYATVLSLMRPLAEKGETKAQTLVGSLYFFGYGVPQDYAEAAKWYRRAADQGRAEAQANLGDMYWKGQGVSRDYAEALELWRSAAEKRRTIPLTNIGLFYAEGIGVARDMCEAYTWWKRAAALDGGLAQNNLSIMFESGDLVSQDNVQALVWATLALKHMEPGQDDVASQAAARRDALAKRMTASQVAQAEKMARETPPAQLVAALPPCS